LAYAVTTLWFASCAVIVTVVADPAVRAVGDALTIKWDTAPAVNITVAVLVKLTDPFTCALIKADPDVVDFTVPEI
jgi:hypothetical protein